MANFYYKQIICIALTFVALLCSVPMGAQETERKGQVVDAASGDPLVGVGVLIQGTLTGSITDLDGNFVINAADDAILVISYMRSGSLGTVFLAVSAAVLAGFLAVTVKPYIAQRFATWGHAWENASVGSGYQQTRTMSAAASGGLVGVGPGEGWLHNVAAGDTDLVFGMLCEDWGLIIAILAVLSIVTLAVFAVRASRAGRSTFYIIAACAATSMMVFQTCLNVFGAVDILPLTGVTFPFVSNGGTAMIASWGLLAYLKATDTRQNASFAIRLPSRKEDRQNAELSMKRTDQWEDQYEED